MTSLYLPHDGMFGVTVYVSAGFNFEQEVRSILDYVEEKADI